MSAPSFEEFVESMSVPGNMPDTEIIFKKKYQQAKAWEDAEKKKDARKLAQLDFSTGAMCIRCSKPCINLSTKKWNPMRCSKCQAVIYCGRECQVADWKASLHPNAAPHKVLCPQNVEHMKRIPHYNAELKQFPWGRSESDGSCQHDVLKARFDVLGSGARFGFWSIPGGSMPHDAHGTRIDPRYARLSQLPSWRKQGYVHGEVLVGTEWPTDVQAWKLKDEKLIPHLFFSDEFPPPKKIESGQLTGWKNWYEWRGLPLDSPAVLLMHYPLSVYHLLVKVLRVADPNASANKRQSLKVHYIGAEVELNFLPLFSELALLLPFTDIELVFFGKPVVDLVQTARAVCPGAMATADTVWSYTAPTKCGGGSISIKLYSRSESWTRQVAEGDQPDALVGLNAGLLSYAAWSEPILFTAILGIPFGVTEYAEQSAELFAREVPHMRQMYVSQIPPGGTLQFAADALQRKRAHPIAVNPFHCPGQRSISMARVPNHYNGFVMPITMKA